MCKTRFQYWQKDGNWSIMYVMYIWGTGQQNHTNNHCDQKPMMVYWGLGFLYGQMDIWICGRLIVLVVSGKNLDELARTCNAAVGSIGLKLADPKTDEAS